MATRRKKRGAKARSEIERRLQHRVRSLRNTGGLTLAELSELAEISVDALTRIESGERAPTLNTIASLAKALGVSVADLIDERPPSLKAETAHLVRLVEEQEADVRAGLLDLAKLFVATLERTGRRS